MLYLQILETCTDFPIIRKEPASNRYNKYIFSSFIGKFSKF